MGAFGIVKGVYNIYRGWNESGDRLDRGFRQLKWGILTTIYDPYGITDVALDSSDFFDSD